MALAKQLIELMGGRISVESDVGRGTIFCVSLPTAPAANNLPLPMAAEPAAGDSISLEPEGTVLYIKDDSASQLILEHFVARWLGIDLVRARTGAQGLALIRELRPALILLDMHLPDMSGLQILELMAASPESAICR